MCGLFGAVLAVAWRRPRVEALGGRLGQILAHRGPDGHGVELLSRNEAALSEDECDKYRGFMGHRRLAVIDRSDMGKQPFPSSCGRYVLVYNGEVYNYRELREELEVGGVRFRSNTDTEVILESWKRWGEGALSRFEGMFAFALYDSVDESIVLVRDVFGIKPLYYSATDSGFFFASEPQALLECPGVSAKLNTNRAVEYLVRGRYDYGTETMFRDIQQVAPASLLRVAMSLPAGYRESEYWHCRMSDSPVQDSDNRPKAFRSLFQPSLGRHMRSDVPVGIAMSGGIDSTAIACGIRQQLPDRPLVGFSYIDECSTTSEESWIDIVGKHLSISPIKIRFQFEDLSRDIEDLVRTQGEPFGSSSIYAQYRVFKAVKEHGITVTLDGQGGDELFGGYGAYMNIHLRDLLTSGKLIQAYQTASGVFADSRFQCVKALLKSVRPHSLRRNRRVLPLWISDEFLGALEDRVVPATLKEATYHNLFGEGLVSLLRHADRNAMRFSVESRVPFLTQSVAEFATSLNDQDLIDTKGRQKAILRDAFRNVLPAEIYHRSDKVGFATSETKWFSRNSDWVDQTLCRSHSVPLLDGVELIAEWRRASGNGQIPSQTWRWINFIHWCEVFNISA